mgnify:CR=1 FL=1
MKKYLTNIDAHNEVVRLLKNNFKIENEKLTQRLNRMKQLK